MKITKIMILGFGQFKDFSLEFNEDMQLIYGKNESGKSTLFQFIRTILFGFQTKKKDNDYSPRHSDVFGGRITLQHPDFGEVVVERIRSRHRGKATVIFEDGKIGDDTSLEEVLKPLTLEIFDGIFSFQHGQLINMKQMSEKSVQNLLFSVGLTGSTYLIDAQTHFSEQASKLYKPQGRQPELNQKINTLSEFEKRLSEREENELTYRTLRSDWQTLKNERDELITISQKLTDEKLSLEKQREAWPTYQEWLVLKESQDKPFNEIDSETLSVLTEGHQNYKFLVKEEKRIKTEMEEDALFNNQSPIFLFYLQNQPKIRRILEERSETEKYIERQKWLEKSLREKRLEKEQIIKVNHWNREFLPLKPDQDGMNQIQNYQKKVSSNLQKQQECKSRIHQLEADERRLNGMIDMAERQSEMQNDYSAQTSSRGGIREILSTFAIGIGLMFILFTFILNLTPAALYLIIGILIFAGGIGLFVLNLNEKQGLFKQSSIKKNLSLLDYTIEQSQEGKTALTSLQQEAATYLTEGNQLALKYRFGEERNPDVWLSWLPSIDRLDAIRVEERQLLKELRESEEVVQHAKASFDILRDWIPIDLRDINEAYRVVENFITKMDQRRLKVLESESGFSRYAQPLEDTRRSKDELLGKMRPLLEKNGIQTISDLPAVIDKQTSHKQEAQRFESLNIIISPLFSKDTTVNLNQLTTQLNEVTAALTKNDAQLSVTEEKYQAVQYELRFMESDDTLDSYYQEYANQLSDVTQLSEEWIANKAAENFVNDILLTLSEKKLPALLEKVSQFFNILSEAHYVRVTFSNNQIVVHTVDHERYSVNELSTGTSDQLYMAFRFAFIDLHYDNCSSPIIIDDGWLHYDSDRKKALFNLLKEFKNKAQILCFSSDEIMEDNFKTANQNIFVLKSKVTA